MGEGGLGGVKVCTSGCTPWFGFSGGNWLHGVPTGGREMVIESGTVAPLLTSAASAPGPPSHAGAGNASHSVVPENVKSGACSPLPLMRGMYQGDAPGALVWRLVAVCSSWWLVAVGGWQLAVGGGRWRLAGVGSWRLAVGNVWSGASSTAAQQTPDQTLPMPPPPTLPCPPPPPHSSLQHNRQHTKGEVLLRANERPSAPFANRFCVGNEGVREEEGSTYPGLCLAKGKGSGGGGGGWGVWRTRQPPTQTQPKISPSGGE